MALNAELSPIRVDHEMKTSLAGLWATGDTSLMGSGCVGAVFAPPALIRGIGLGNSVQSALRAAPSAARFASEASTPKVSYEEVKRLKDVIFAPMGRTKGFSAEEAIYGIQDVMCRFKYNLCRSKDRLEEGLSKIEKVQQRLPELWAKDGHGLGKCHEARNIAVCGEMTLRAADENGKQGISLQGGLSKTGRQELAQVDNYQREVGEDGCFYGASTYRKIQVQTLREAES